MYEYQAILDCMIFTSNGTISLDVHVGSEENLNLNELSIYASRQCITKCNMYDLEFYGFKIMRIHRLKLDKINLIYKPFERKENEKMKDLLIHTTHTIKTSLKTETHRFVFRITQEQAPCFMVWCLNRKYIVDRITYAE